MLSGASFLSYQAAPLKTIRDAIQDSEHHIVRVNEEGTGEIYDLNLSNSKPYASPVQRSIAVSQKPQQHEANSAEGGAGLPSGSRNVNGLRVEGADSAQTSDSANSSAATAVGKDEHSPLQRLKPLRLIAHVPSASSASEKEQSNAKSNSSPSTPPEFARRALRIPHLVGKRQHDGDAKVFDLASTLSGEANRDALQEPHDFALNRHLQADELPPSPPLEDELNNDVPVQPATTAKEATVESGTSETTREHPPSISSKEKSLPERRLPRRATTDDPTSIRRSLVRRETSVNSTTSSAYMTASSRDDSVEDGAEDARPVIVAEPTSYLHPSSAAQQDVGASSSRKMASTSSLSHSASPTRSPSRRNTTGGAAPGYPLRRRHGSVGSQASQSNLRQAAQEGGDETAPHPAAPARLQGAPVQTGDAGFDEVVAKQYDQILRERETKKMREMQSGAPDHEQNGKGLHVQDGGLSARGGGATLQRAKSRRGTEDEGPKAMIGNVIGEGHVNYVLMYNMLTGIRIGVSRCHAKMKRPLTDADYTAKHKFTFDIVGNELTPEAKYDFKFKDYAPWVFRELREHFHLDPADYLFSLTAKYILSELGSPGKSGSFFYFSRDYRFIIKTIRHNEHKFLRKILKDYHLHIKENPHTLLSRFYGLHRVKLPGGKKIHFVIMNNLFPPHKDIHETYDLKGSAVGREYSEEKAAQKKGAVLKDLNWINRGRELELGPAKCALFGSQIRSDVALLQRLGIMDYSLLIGLHDMKRGNKEGLRQDALQVVQPDNQPQQSAPQSGQIPGLRREPTRTEKEAYALRAAVRRSDAKALGSSSAAKLPERETSDRHHLIFYQDEGGFRSTDGENRPSDWIYYFGIIDTLTLYSGVKRSEHYWKSLSHNSRMISAIHPVPYGQRFCDFLFSVIKGADKSRRPRMQ